MSFFATTVSYHKGDKGDKGDPGNAPTLDEIVPVLVPEVVPVLIPEVVPVLIPAVVALVPYCSVGSFTCPGAVGNYSVTGLGFQPKLVKFWVSKGPGLQTHFCCCEGMMDAAGNQNSMTWAGVWSNIFKGDSRVDLCMYTINSAGTSQVTGAFVSMNADGFTVNFTAVNNAFIVRWEAIG